MERRSSGDQVASHIRWMVYSGQLRPGDRVRQDDIAAQLGVSRIPVREAIIALDREGWVTIEPHRGAYVNGLDPGYIHDHYELYGLLFGLTARRVIERADDAGLAAVASAAKAVADADDVTAFNAANTAFLQTLNHVAAAPRLTSLARIMTSVVPGNFFAEVPGTMELQRKGVAAVARAIKAGDADRAAHEFQVLLGRHGDAVVRLLEGRGVFAEPDGPGAAAS